MQLRNLGIYALPDGREMIAEVEPGRGYSLYPPHIWNHFRFTEYRVNADGRLLVKGKPTGWSVEQLRDTGRAANYPRSSRLL